MDTTNFCWKTFKFSREHKYIRRRSFPCTIHLNLDWMFDVWGPGSDLNLSENWPQGTRSSIQTQMQLQGSLPTFDGGEIVSENYYVNYHKFERLENPVGRGYKYLRFLGDTGGRRSAYTKDSKWSTQKTQLNCFSANTNIFSNVNIGENIFKTI